jgi:subtilisin family serine protease
MAEAKKATARRSTKKAAKRPGGSAGGGGGRDVPEIPEIRDSQGRLSVLVEMAAGAGMSPTFAASGLRDDAPAGLVLDEEFQAVPMGAGPVGFGIAAPAGSFVVRALVADDAAARALRDRPDVLDVWKDTPIAPFACPIPPCDCDPGTPKGTIADVANYLGVSQIWAAGTRGTGMVVGVVDSGITAQGRPVAAGQTHRRISRVIGGWPTGDWGTRTEWGGHGNMCATDVLGMAPEAQIYDLRIAGGDFISSVSRALQAFQWAIDRHRVDGTPHILTNSWGMFQQSWDPSYGSNPNHPFTRKVVEALDEGILVLFAAGNCGDTCPDGRCGADNGPGRSIWGANSHPRVMTVGAVNKNEEFVGYSSQGPGALDPNKPDFCSVTHFAGYFASDSGTSAATPILAGAVALLKQAAPGASQDTIKNALKATAKDIGPAGFDQHSGAGIVRLKAAYDRLTTRVVPRTPVLPCGPLPLTPVVPCAVRTPVCVRPTVVDPQCVVVKSIGPGCFRPTIACPTFGGGFCTPTPFPREPVPQPNVGAEGQAGDEVQYDPAWAYWYGQGDPSQWGAQEGEQWYGGYQDQ